MEASTAFFLPTAERRLNRCSTNCGVYSAGGPAVFMLRKWPRV